VGNNIGCASQPACSNGIYDISPVTVVKNPSTNVERLFFSMPKEGTAAGCTGACVYMFDLAGTWNTSKTATAAFAVPGGTGGIIVDNARPAADIGSSQIYFAQQDQAVFKQWTASFDANVTTPGTFTLNGVTFNAGSSTSCTSSGGTYDVSGDFKSDANALKACLLAANLPGFKIAGENATNNGTVVVTSTSKGNPADTLVQETMTNVSMTIVQGTASTAGNAVQVSQSALQ
jgi:hypothetical protein